MNSKWYVCTFFLLFIFLGTFQEKTLIPNQEIVLEFVYGKVDKKDINSTIANVKKRLITIGATNINIQKNKKGALTISYYSAIHVDAIKKALTSENKIASLQKPENEERNIPSSTYHIDVYELTNEVDITNLNDKYVFEIKYISERSTTTNSYASLKNASVYKANQLFKTAYTFYKSNPLTKDKTSYKEPEVRAGPNTFFM